MTITLQALSLVEEVEPVQVRFTLRLRDSWSMWMQDGCKVCMDSYVASNGSCFMVTCVIFKKPPLGGRPNTKPGECGTLNTHNRWFILLCHVWGPTWIKIHWNSILVKDPVTYDFTLYLSVHDHTTWFWRGCWDGLWTLSFGLSQSLGHGAWLVCEMALTAGSPRAVLGSWKHLDLTNYVQNSFLDAVLKARCCCILYKQCPNPLNLARFLIRIPRLQAYSGTSNLSSCSLFWVANKTLIS